MNATRTSGTGTGVNTAIVSHSVGRLNGREWMRDANIFNFNTLTALKGTRPYWHVPHVSLYDVHMNAMGVACFILRL